MNILNNKLNLRREQLLKLIIIFLIASGAVAYHLSEIKNVKASYDSKLLSLETDNKKTHDDYITYKVMYESVNNTVNQYKQERDYATKQYNYITNQIKYSKLEDSLKVSRGGYENHSLKDYPIITIDEMNEFIKSVVPKDSPFIGRGEEFLKASKINGVDPRYIFAHACVESAYGKSNLALNRGNYFGINAINSDPNKAYDMGDGLHSGIQNGAEWIADNYINNGYDTLDKMATRGYAVYDNGNPNTDWMNQITNIATRFK